MPVACGNDTVAARPPSSYTPHDLGNATGSRLAQLGSVDERDLPAHSPQARVQQTLLPCCCLASPRCARGRDDDLWNAMSAFGAAVASFYHLVGADAERGRYSDRKRWPEALGPSPLI